MLLDLGFAAPRFAEAYMNTSKFTRLAASCALALGLAACGADGNSNTTGGGGTGGGTGPRLILDDTQTQLSGTLTGLAGLIGTDNPLGALVFCLDPTVNDLVDGPDALLTNLLGSLNTTLGTQDPAALQAALLASGDSLSTALQSLTVNLPNALMALADPSAVSNCGSQGGTTGGGTGGSPLDALIALFGGGSNPFAGTPLEALGTLGGSGTPAGGPTGTPLDAILGPLLAIQNGGANGEIVDQLGQGVAQLGTALSDNLPDQVVTAPIVGGVLVLLSDTLVDLGGVLDQIEQPSTAAELQALLNNLLSNLTGTLIGLDPTGQLASTAGPQIQAGINQLTDSLGAILVPLAGTDGLLPTLLNPLSALTCPLKLTGNCGATGSTGGDNPLAGIPLLGDLLGGGLPTGGTGSTGPLSGALAGTPLAPIGGLLGLLGL
ncbi:MAG: hypothetical protein ACI87C_000232 [Paraperlucidibaca sp.]